ncbi:MAG: hypothetical protein FH756_07350 [Firmicutes bacterium]|nr:hypothetical protein [Bacillota bacterium]
MKTVDFTLEMYSQICQALKPYHVLAVVDFLSMKIEKPFTIIRHDVDRCISNALAMAKLESKYGIISTYYFRYPYTYNKEVMSEINSLGHEIGYHYEVLDKTKGRYQKAIELFKEELEIFRKDFQVVTICMHGNPLTKWDGRTLWDKYDMQKLGIIGETYVSFRDKNVKYLTDTGRTWNNAFQFKDTLGKKQINVKNSKELVNLLKAKKYHNLYILTHPERWAFNSLNYIRGYSRDFVFKTGKRVIGMIK